MSSFEGVLVSDPWLQSQFTQVEFRGLKSKFIAIRNQATNRVKVADMPGTLVRMKTLHDMFEEHEIKQILQETFPDENEEIDFESFVRATLTLQNQAAAKAGTPRHGSSFLKAPTTTFHHIINTSEKHSYVAHINNYLADDDFLKDFLPIDPDTNDLFEIAKDGILLCKLINLAVPGTIDERAINIKKVLNPWERNENHTLCLNSAKAIGCTVVNIGTQDLVEARPHLLLGLISQIVKIQLLADLNIDKSPELVELIEDESKDAEEELNKLSPEKVLLKWMNFHLKKAGYKKQVTNFSSDVKDGEAYAYLLTALAPETSSPSTLDVKDPDERAKLVLEQAEKLECTQYLTAKDIVDGSPNLNLAFVADIFQHSKKSARKKTKGSWDLIKACSRLRTATKGKKRGYAHFILLAASVPIGLWSSLRLVNPANATRPMHVEWFLLAMSVVMGVTAISIMIRRGTWRPVTRTSPGKGKKFQ